MLLQPSPKRAFVRGPTLAPAETLVARLAAHTGRLLRMPVVVERTPLGARGGTLGGVRVLLEDSALGISLADRVRTACPGEGPCTVWLEGRWLGDAEQTVKVLHFDRAAAPEEPADAIELEAE